MEFEQILDKYYFENQKIIVIKLLNEISAFKSIENVINEYFKEIVNKNKYEIAVILSNTITNVIISINTGKKNINNNLFEKEKELIQFGVYLIKETFKHSNLSSQDYFSVLKQTIKTVYLKYNWNYEILSQLLNFDNLKFFSQKPQKIIITPKQQYLVWNSKHILDIFVGDMIQIIDIKPKKNIFKLFDTIDDNFKIEINSKHLEQFLSLFYLLNQCKVITAKGNRGIYKYLKKHIIPQKNDNLPDIEFRKLRYNTFLNKKKKEKILKTLNPLIIKYCDNGQ